MKTFDIYVDPNLRVANTAKLHLDLKEFSFNKLCMTQVINADLSIAAYGEDVYYAGCRDVLHNVQAALNEFGLDKAIYLYSYNYSNFILAANDNISKEDFLDVMKKFYIQFESAASSQVDVSGVSRFAVVLQEDRLIERAIHGLMSGKDTQDNFIITPDVLDVASSIKNDANILDLINFAMAGKRVIPYYQGIRNNKTGKIEKYEALMRLMDKDGKIYSPAQFLDIAKKYKIYNRLSQIMIKRALLEFRDRPEQLSINISAYDISNEHFRTWFYRQLGKYPNCDRVVVEFVETENYQDEMLFDFIEKVRSFGCSISVDDFGSGYATYTTIISLSPAFIKIDGTIIKDIATSEKNVIILRSICFMANLIKAKTIAEFVENEDIQAILEQYGVNYSQGYYYSKPQPINELPVAEVDEIALSKC